MTADEAEFNDGDRVRQGQRRGTFKDWVLRAQTSVMGQPPGKYGYSERDPLVLWDGSYGPEVVFGPLELDDC